MEEKFISSFVWLNSNFPFASYTIPVTFRLFLCVLCKELVNEIKSWCYWVYLLTYTWMMHGSKMSTKIIFYLLSKNIFLIRLTMIKNKWMKSKTRTSLFDIFLVSCERHFILDAQRKRYEKFRWKKGIDCMLRMLTGSALNYYSHIIFVT